MYGVTDQDARRDWPDDSEEPGVGASHWKLFEFEGVVFASCGDWWDS